MICAYRRTLAPIPPEAGPPCDDLLRDPAAILADPARWPRHLCATVAPASTEAWTRALPLGVLAPPARELDAHWRSAWPLPVGRATLHAWAVAEARRLRLDPSAALPLVWAAPLVAEGWAALILTVPVADATVTLFGLAAPDPGPTPIALAGLAAAPRCRLAALHAQIAGSGDLTPAAAFVRQAQRWWRRWLLGRPLVGRPPGSVVRTPAWYLNAFRAYRATCGEAAPTRDGFIRDLRRAGEQVDRKRLRANLTAAGLWPWERFVAAALDEDTTAP